MKYLRLVIATLLIPATLTFAHGEHRPGPHGGEIRMPGSFHTEVVSPTPTTFQVYILGVQFEDRPPQGWTVSSSYDGSPATCERTRSSFSCRLKTGSLRAPGMLEIKVTRGNKESTANYETPLKF